MDLEREEVKIVVVREAFYRESVPQSNRSEEEAI